MEGYGEKAEESLKDEGDGWVSTPMEHRQGPADEEIPSLEPSSRGARANPAKEDNDDDDDIPDIDDLALEDAEEDEVKCQRLSYQMTCCSIRFDLLSSLHPCISNEMALSQRIQCRLRFQAMH